MGSGEGVESGRSKRGEGREEGDGRRERGGGESGISRVGRSSGSGGGGGPSPVHPNLPDRNSILIGSVQQSTCYGGNGW